MNNKSSKRVSSIFMALVLALSIFLPVQTFAATGEALSEDKEANVLKDIVIDDNEDYYVTKGNEEWSNTVINTDVHISPNSILTIKNNVKINGDIYVYGGLRSEGGLFVNGTLHARNLTEEINTPIYQGEVQLEGTNDIDERVIGKEAYDVPLEVFNEDLTNKSRSVTIEGKTLPFLDIATRGEAVESDDRGEFTVTIDDMVTDQVVFELTNNFKQTITKTVEVTDVIPPESPEVEQVTDEATEITGTAEPGTTVSAVIAGEEIGAATVEEDGSFVIEIEAQEHDTTITLTATDRAGNISYPVIVKVVDITAPAAPQVNTISEKTTTITGTAEAESTVIANAGDSQLGRITVPESGEFEIPIVKQAAGTEITVTATDKAGNVSKAAVLTVKPEAERLYGHTRYDTAIEASKQGWDEADTVIIARGDDFADALAGVPLAHKLDAPILMTQPNKLWENTLKEIKRLGAENVIILGGETAVSKDVFEVLAEEGLEVERLNGDSRFETAALIADLVAPEGTKEAVVANGMDFPDALSVASYAAKEGLPILLTLDDRVAQATGEAVESLGVEETIVVGGEAAISEAVEKALPDATRLSGKDRYETNIAIAGHFGVDSNHVYVATGNNFADALTGGVLAAKENSAILLVHHDVPASVASYMNTKNFESLAIFGGPGAVDEPIEEKLTDLLQ
ncbi:cell wall-binding repeat-containing protein [Oceanobacillus alkalisoli]|uniref:cell wall-binding repeat-containing protein n=1 Tax=Oceanobacillus alkalisoli TaxID=2925113 RepID=UPI001EE4E90D|nr:cell wall-binding repeat-containing protein [Oceanobacillus alkalisoli]MCG5102647.1 cell wall-binding repeat-containing protein [Oceanobacillus alkalisoli]